MQKLGLQQSQQQSLSPQQIQFIKLLQIPTAELDARIEEELEQNPVLEEGKTSAEEELYGQEYEEAPQDDFDEDLDIDDYINHDDIAGYKMQGDSYDPNEENKDAPIATYSTMGENLMAQLNYLDLDERQHTIGQQLIGSIESDGYIRRDLQSIVNDLAFMQNVETSYGEVEQILEKIQEFDPPGIAARDLQECLLIQLKRKNETTEEEITRLAIQLIEDNFELFTKKHYGKIQRNLGLKDSEKLKEAIDLITRLNPKPGQNTGGGAVQAQVVVPDYILKNDAGELKLSLNARNSPELNISPHYAEMLDAYDKSDKQDKQVKEAAAFVKQKLDSAKWFIDAIKQRQNTLMSTMNAILDLQYEFFLDGDETKLKPMILKDVADIIGMDISTVSRVANSKYIETDFGVFPLKYFFSEAIATQDGTEVSSRQVKYELQKFIDEEDKRKPLSDEKLEKMLKEKGYKIARRTVAKYREQLQIPIARLRKELF